MIGQVLGSYTVVAKLGEGGMGQVYRAHDSKLGRDVAIKVLPPMFASDPERLARFEREAKALAALNHHNIAHIHGFEEIGPVRALVMELVAGEDLSTVIKRGPIPLAEALPIARQLADALEAAHEQGIIHRDLKPANIKIRDDGAVKVLDFGLAKALGPDSGGASDQVMNSPTLTAQATQMGIILGTAAYMAPEQAKGKAVDRRADIWAFGVVLYEMLTAKCPFVSDTIPETLAYVMTREVDLALLPADTPASVRQMIARCLVKDPKHRLRDIGDARLVLAEPAESSAALSAVAAQPARRRASLGVLPVAAVALVAALLAATAAWLAKPVPSSAPATFRMSIALLPGEQVTTPPAISRDGQTIAYVAGRSAATSRLYLRRLDSFATHAVDSGASATLPFFSPDGRFVAFFASGKLWKAAVAGGAASPIASASKGWGGSWGDDGRIVYVPSLNAGVWRVPADGGKPEQLTQPDDQAKGYAHTFPQLLPNGDVLFSIWGRTFYVAVLTPGNETWREATPEGKRSSPGLYAQSGHLLIGDVAANMRAGAWTPASTAPATTDTAVLDNVNWTPGTDRPWINVSSTGTAVYAPGNPDNRHLAWIDRQGRITQLPGDPEQITHASVSRDGHRIVYNHRDSQWVRDLVSGTRTRIVADQRSWTGGWLPGDAAIVISSNSTGDWDLNTIPSRGGPLTPVLPRPRTQHPLAVAPDGTILFLDNNTATGNDIWKLSPDGTASPVVATRFHDTAGNVSPDGRYLAYMSDESGRNDVYALPMSGQGERVMVSIDGGTGPVWSRDGRELFYRAGDDLVSVDVKSTTPLVLGERRTLLDVSGFESMFFHEFDVSADGQRFLFIRADPGSRPTRLDVIVNWFPELSRLVAK